MKTKILSLIVILGVVLGLGNAAYATTENGENSTVLTGVSKINKIEVHGNVEVFVSYGAADQVKVYNKYYAENALVQNQDNILRISSYKSEKLVVWVIVNDLRAITAYDNSTIKSFGNLPFIGLEVELYNTALAKLNLDSYTENVTVNDRAKADLSGSVSECNVKYSRSSSVNTSNLTPVIYSKTMIEDNTYKAASQEMTAL